VVLVAHAWFEDEDGEGVRIISARKATGRERLAYEHDPDRHKAEIEALAKLNEAVVDTSDLPEVADWSKGVRGRFYRPTKQSVTIRLDTYVVAWFKARANKGYKETPGQPGSGDRTTSGSRPPVLRGLMHIRPRGWLLRPRCEGRVTGKHFG
jgi:uncharacterized protein (DUF4415 family)